MRIYLSSSVDALVICDVLNIPNYIVNISSTSQIKDYNEYNNYFNTNVNNLKLILKIMKKYYM